MKKKFLLPYLVMFLGIAVAGVFFILNSNDHAECTNISKTTTDMAGTVTQVREHQCQEKFAI